MNERLKELAEQAGFEPLAGGYHGYDDELERFTDLVRADERERVYNILISGDCDGSVKAYIRKILEQGAEN